MKPPRPDLKETGAGSLGAVLARGAFFNALAFFASTLRGIFMLLVARLLGSATLGIFGLAWAAMDLLSKFATLGLDYSSIAFVAKAEAAADRAGSRRVLRTAVTICLLSGFALSLAGFLLVWNFGPRFGLRPELARATAVMMLALPGVALYRVSNGLSRGMAVMHHDIFSRGLIDTLGTAAALLVAFALGLRELAPEIAAIAGASASGLVAFLLARRLFARTAPAVAGPVERGFTNRLMQASGPIALSDLLNVGVMQIDLILLGWFVGRAPGVTLATLGIYTAGVEIASGLRKVSQAFLPIFMPVVARQIAAGQMRAAEETYGYLARWMLALLLPALIVLALCGSAILRIFGPDFPRGGVWMAIVGAACALNAFVSLGETILMVERPGLNLGNSAIAFIAAIGCNLVFIPALGPLGAALGMLVPYTIQGLLRGFQIPRLLDWHWPWRALLKPWWAALLALPLALLVVFFSRGSLGQILAAAVYLSGYFLAWRFIGLDRSDREVLDHLLGRKTCALKRVEKEP
ncbi:MAG: lipopolysaccharide biosynthesis protein [Chthoniobacterales bacterium]